MATKAERITQAQKAVADAQAAYDASSAEHRANQDKYTAIKDKVDELMKQLERELSAAEMARRSSTYPMMARSKELAQAKKDLAALIASTK